jgi:hypothetical protein
MLDNITIRQTDVWAIKHDIMERYDPDNIIYQNALNEAKREIYGLIKSRLRADYPSNTDADLDTLVEYVRDYENEQYLKKRIVYMIVAFIYRQNEMEDRASYYDQLAQKTPLDYYLDKDESESASLTEQRIDKAVIFGR